MLLIVSTSVRVMAFAEDIYCKYLYNGRDYSVPAYIYILFDGRGGGWHIEYPSVAAVTICSRLTARVLTFANYYPKTARW